MSRTRTREIGVGALLVASLGLLAWMSIQVGALQGMGPAVAVSATLDDAAGLTEGAEVKVAGVAVGVVTRLTVDHDVAVVDFEVRESAGLRRDAIVQVRARSLLGEKYLDVSPQGRDAALLRDGDRIETARSQTEIDQLVNALGPVVDAADPEQLQAVVATIHRVLAEDPERLERMVRIWRRCSTTARPPPRSCRRSPPRPERPSRRSAASARQTAPVVEKAGVIAVRVEAATEDLPATAEELDGLITETRGAVGEARVLMGDLSASTDDLKLVLDNLSEIDRWELRRLLREEGILVRLRASEVEEARP